MSNELFKKIKKIILMFFQIKKYLKNQLSSLYQTLKHGLRYQTTYYHIYHIQFKV